MVEAIVTVFGSSKPTPGESSYREAECLGRILAESGFTLCNGGYRGTMEASAKGAREAGGKTIGVTTDEFLGLKANSWITEEKRVPTWRERLFCLIDLGSGFVVLDGGTGTLAEFAVVWEMSRRNLIGSKPIILLGKFWHALLESLQRSPEMEPSPQFFLAKNAEEAASRLKKVLIQK